MERTYLIKSQQRSGQTDVDNLLCGAEVGILGVDAELHAFLDILEVKSKPYGYQPKLNFVYGS